MYYSWGDIFTDLSLRVLFHVVHGCTSVEPAEVILSGSSTAIAGEELMLSCFATSSNPPVQIRWWLGYKELNNTVVTMEEVRPHRIQFAQSLNPSQQVDTRTIKRTGQRYTCFCFVSVNTKGKVVKNNLQKYCLSVKSCLRGTI